MKIKNTAPGGRGLGIAGQEPIEWAPGEVKEVDAATVAKAKADPANAGLFGEGGLVEVKSAAAPDDASDAGDKPAKAKAAAK